MPPISLPEPLRMAMDGWGGGMLTAASRARAQFLARADGVSSRTAAASHDMLSGVPLVLGTDCSGADAPVWALRSLWPGRRFVHAFACDNWRAAENVVKANSACAAFFADMLTRAPERVPHHNLYVCGFPCQPFSTLRQNSQLFAEAKAKPFRAMLRTMRAKRPQVAVLENVRGIVRVRARLERSLRSIGGYCVTILRLDPRTLGEPVCRPRVYIVCVRLDVLTCTSRSAADQLASAVLESITKPVQCSAPDRLLPNSHALVSTHLSSAPSSRESMRQTRVASTPRKWYDEHRLFRARLARSGKASASAGGVPPARLVSGARAKEAWELWCSARPSLTAADISQGITRVTCMENGCLPTITPGSCIVVRSLNRAMLGIEKLLAHGFPLHRFVIPETTTESDLHRLGGQTMHVQCVAAAILIGCSLVDWSKPAARSGVTPPALGDSWPVSWLGSWPVAARCDVGPKHARGGSDAATTGLPAAKRQKLAAPPRAKIASGTGTPKRRSDSSGRRAAKSAAKSAAAAARKRPPAARDASGLLGLRALFG